MSLSEYFKYLKQIRFWHSGNTGFGICYMYFSEYANEAHDLLYFKKPLHFKFEFATIKTRIVIMDKNSYESVIYWGTNYKEIEGLEDFIQNYSPTKQFAICVYDLDGRLVNPNQNQWPYSEGFLAPPQSKL